MIIDLTNSPVPVTAEAVALSVTAISAQRGFLTVFACDEGQPADVEPQHPRRVPDPEPGRRRGRRRSPRVHLFVVRGQRDRRRHRLVGRWSRSLHAGRPRCARSTPASSRRRQAAGRAGAGDPARRSATCRAMPPRRWSIWPSSKGCRSGSSSPSRAATPTPLASNLNFLAGEARAVAAIVGLGPDGDLCVMSQRRRARRSSTSPAATPRRRRSGRAAALDIDSSGTVWSTRARPTGRGARRSRPARSAGSIHSPARCSPARAAPSCSTSSPPGSPPPDGWRCSRAGAGADGVVAQLDARRRGDQPGAGRARRPRAEVCVQLVDRHRPGGRPVRCDGPRRRLAGRAGVVRRAHRRSPTSPGRAATTA